MSCIPGYSWIQTSIPLSQSVFEVAFLELLILGQARMTH